MRPLNRLNLPTLTVTDADKDQNTTFNTNLGAIETQLAMVIHRIQVQCNMQGAIVADPFNLLIGALSEDTGATSAVAEGADPRSLFLYERDFIGKFTTSGASLQIYDAIQTFELDPWPIITVSQTLNWLGEMVEKVAGTQVDYIMTGFLWYTLEPISDDLRQRLLERISLAT